MTENLISSPQAVSTMTVITKNEVKESAKLIPLKKPVNKKIVLLPPQPEKYIKAKKHDFL